MYQVIIPNSVKRDMKRLDKAVMKSIIDSLDILSKNPHLGTHLAGELSQLFKLSVRQRKVEYRIVYKIIENRLEVHVMHIGTRENFYNSLQRRL